MTKKIANSRRIGDQHVTESFEYAAVAHLARSELHHQLAQHRPKHSGQLGAESTATRPSRHRALYASRGSHYLHTHEAGGKIDSSARVIDSRTIGMPVVKVKLG